MILFGLLVLVAGILYSMFLLDTPKRYWGLLISLGAFLFFLVLALIVRGCGKSAWLKKRQMSLQRTLDEYNSNYLKDKHCHVNAGPYGSYLKFIFTVSFKLQ